MPPTVRAATRRFLFAALLLGAALPAAAQRFELDGFIKSAYYYDTQQLVGAREGDFVLYPALATDADDEPNDTDNLLFYPLFSRVALSVGGVPEALGAEVTGLLEADFFGASDALNNSFRIRRSFVKMDWGSREALFGMEWSPFFASAWPRTVASELGAAFNPFARMPMIQVTFKPENFRLSGTLAQQRDAFQEIGGRKQQQQAGLPAAMLTAQFGRGGNTIGANAMVKWIRPTLTSERFSSGAVQGFANFASESIEARANVTFGGDLADHLLTGGYVATGPDRFHALNTLAVWGDVQSRGATSLGLFVGYTENLGTGESGLNPNAVAFVARGYETTNAVASLWRVAPRVVHRAGALRFGFEVQATAAAYVTGPNPSAIYDDALRPAGEAEQVVNLRGNLSVFLDF